MRPSVFVVDGQTDVPFRRLGPRRRKASCSATRLGLGLLLLLLVAGLVVQGCFLLQLRWRIEKMVSRGHGSLGGAWKREGPWVADRPSASQDAAGLWEQQPSASKLSCPGSGENTKRQGGAKRRPAGKSCLEPRPLHTLIQSEPGIRLAPHPLRR